MMSGNEKKKLSIKTIYKIRKIQQKMINFSFSTCFSKNGTLTAIALYKNTICNRRHCLQINSLTIFGYLFNSIHKDSQ